VVAAGYNREAYIPSWPGVTDYRGGLLHSSQYKNGAFQESKSTGGGLRETSLPGLYFCGYYVSPTAMLREIALEAQQISSDISRMFKGMNG
jgi:hypothetical protein